MTMGNKTDIISKLASVAQSVVHLTRNEKVACSSQVTSSKNPECESVRDFYFFTLHFSLITKTRIWHFWKGISKK